MNYPTQTSQSFPSTLNQFKLITYIDRINFFSDNYIKYYKQLFDAEEFIFVINGKDQKLIVEYLKDNGFTDNSFHVYITRKAFGYGEQTGFQNKVKTILIDRGYIVVYADIDEIIYHPDFKSFIVNSPKQLFCSRGIEIVQGPSEGYLDVTKPILEQRKLGQFNEYYNKVCVLKKDFTWTAGRHNRETVQVNENLYLLDIGKVCKRIMLENNKKTTELYSGVFPRYAYTTIEQIEQEYKTYLKKPAFIPDAVINHCKL